MSTRTSIRIGTILDSSMKERLPGYERVLEEYTSQYLLFGYRKPILGHYYATVLFQASKTFGGLTCEVGLSRTKDFPYYRFYDSPSIGVAGFRARTAHVIRGLDSTTTKLYSGPDVLLGHIMDLVSEAIKAGNKLIEESVPRVAEQFRIWQPLYEEWVEAEKKAQPDSEGLRYPNLVGEAVARKILHDTLRSGCFDSFLGPKKFRYREPNFQNCHVYLLAKALSFEVPPEEHEILPLEIDPGQNPDKILFDPIGAISGRSEQPEAVELSGKILERVPQWAFLRSYAALEALFESETIALDKVASYAVEPKKKEPPKPAGMSLDDLYSDVYSAPSSALSGVAPEPVAASSTAVVPEPMQSRPKLGRNRIDPFETVGDYLNGNAAIQAPPADTFDFLGAHLGLGL